jgi:DNA-binding response OmpR family regulator
MRILLLEDDAVLSEIVGEFLSDSGHEVRRVFNGDEAEELIADHPFDLLLLDINVPGKNGLRLFQGLSRAIPTLFITAVQSAAELKKAFELGADDYIKKPFDLEELEARINHVKRIHGIEQGGFAITPGLFFDPENLRLEYHGETFQLKRKEAEILLFFVKNRRRIISGEELIANIWAYDEPPTDATIRTYIKNLRHLIGKEAITTIKGSGYRFDPL